MKTVAAIIAALVVIGGGIVLYNRYNTGTSSDVNLNIGNIPIFKPGTTTNEIVPGIDVDIATSATSSNTTSDSQIGTTSRSINPGGY